MASTPPFPPFPPFPPSPFSLRLAFNVDLWKPQDQEFQEALNHLTPVEQKRVKSLGSERDRKQSLIGRLFILYACKQFFSFLPSQDPYKPNSHPFAYYFGRTPQNRPVIIYTSNSKLSGTVSDPFAQLRDFDFNVSHHGSWVICACEEGCIVGCDVTKFETNRDNSESVDSFFESFQGTLAEHEWAHIELKEENSPKFEAQKERDRLRLQNFHRYWGLKESYIKAIGFGLGFELLRCQFTISEPMSLITPSPQDQKGYPKIIGHSTTQIDVDGKREASWRFEEVLLDSEHLIVTCLGPISGAIPDLKKTFPSQKRKERNPNSAKESEPNVHHVRPYDAARANFEVLDWMTLRRGI